MIGMEKRELRSKRLTLRLIEPGDAQALREILCDPEVTKPAGFLPIETEEEIVRDYLLSRECLRSRLALVRQRFPELDMNIVIPSERHIMGFLRLWEEKYHTAEHYLQAIGLTNSQIEKLRRKLC